MLPQPLDARSFPEPSVHRSEQESCPDSEGWTKPSSLYIHIPFCPYKCAYCDFVTYVGGAALVDPYVEALCLEIERIAEPGSRLETVYFGGGTPSLLSPAQVARILHTVDRTFGLVKEAEVSLESNPGTVDATKLAGVRATGVNRLSIGVQSLRTQELKALGRGHGVSDVVEAVEMARHARFDSLSLDLIYGTPEQTLETWAATLQGALELEPDHVSLYSLIIEPGTRFNRLHRDGLLGVPEDDVVADMYDVACEVLGARGFIHYEVANWSTPGHESRHNRMYWRDEQFFAVGVGAYDYLRPYRSVRVKSTKRYIEHIVAGQDAISQRHHVDPDDERFETCVMGLRLLQEGLRRSIYQQRFSESLEERYGDVLNELEQLGFIEDTGEAIRLREEKVPLANEAWERFLPTAGNR